MRNNKANALLFIEKLSIKSPPYNVERGYMLRMKLQTEQGEIIPVENIQVLTSEKQYYAGIMTWKYKCKAVSNEREQEFILLFTPETCSWKMIL